jgi:predicted phosphoribosyltransferase
MFRAKREPSDTPSSNAELRFHDRTEAGRWLAQKLRAYASRHDVIVLGLPRGGVPVASQIAAFLRAPLDILLVRKLGFPGHEELAMGAIASGGVRVFNDDVLDQLTDRAAALHSAIARESAEIERRERLYRGTRPPLDLRGRTVILVDDGLATGATMRAAVAAVRQLHAARIVVAVPVGSPEAHAELAHEAHEVICGMTPESFRAVGQYYDDFSQTTDDEVRDLLAAAPSVA